MCHLPKFALVLGAPEDVKAILSHPHARRIVCASAPLTTAAGLGKRQSAFLLRLVIGVVIVPLQHKRPRHLYRLEYDGITYVYPG